MHLGCLIIIIIQANVFEEDFKHERVDHTKAVSRHEEEVQRLKLQLDEQIAHAKDMMEPMELVKQRLEVSLEAAREEVQVKKRLEVSLQSVQVSLEAAQEEVQVKTTQLMQYKKQVDSLKEKVGCFSRIYSTALWCYVNVQCCACGCTVYTMYTLFMVYVCTDPLIATFFQE